MSDVLSLTYIIVSGGRGVTFHIYLFHKDLYGSLLQRGRGDEKTQTFPYRFYCYRSSKSKMKSKVKTISLKSRDGGGLAATKHQFDNILTNSKRAEKRNHKKKLFIFSISIYIFYYKGFISGFNKKFNYIDCLRILGQKRQNALTNFHWPSGVKKIRVDGVHPKTEQLSTLGRSSSLVQQVPRRLPTSAT